MLKIVFDFAHDSLRYNKFLVDDELNSRASHIIFSGMRNYLSVLDEEGFDAMIKNLVVLLDYLSKSECFMIFEYA